MVATNGLVTFCVGGMVLVASLFTISFGSTFSKVLVVCILVHLCAVGGCPSLIVVVLSCICSVVAAGSQ